MCVIVATNTTNTCLHSSSNQNFGHARIWKLQKGEARFGNWMKRDAKTGGNAMRKLDETWFGNCETCFGNCMNHDSETWWSMMWKEEVLRTTYRDECRRTWFGNWKHRSKNVIPKLNAKTWQVVIGGRFNTPPFSLQSFHIECHSDHSRLIRPVPGNSAAQHGNRAHVVSDCGHGRSAAPHCLALRSWKGECLDWHWPYQPCVKGVWFEFLQHGFHLPGSLRSLGSFCFVLAQPFSEHAPCFNLSHHLFRFPHRAWVFFTMSLTMDYAECAATDTGRLLLVLAKLSAQARLAQAAICVKTPVSTRLTVSSPVHLTAQKFMRACSTLCKHLTSERCSVLSDTCEIKKLCKIWWSLGQLE